jgi:hypothetical protein
MGHQRAQTRASVAEYAPKASPWLRRAPRPTQPALLLARKPTYARARVAIVPWQQRGNRRMSRWVRRGPRGPLSGTFRTPTDACCRGLHGSGPCLGNQVEVRVLSSALSSALEQLREARIQPRTAREARGECAATSARRPRHLMTAGRLRRQLGCDRRWPSRRLATSSQRSLRLRQTCRTAHASVRFQGESCGSARTAAFMARRCARVLRQAFSTSNSSASPAKARPRIVACPVAISGPSSGLPARSG